MVENNVEKYVNTYAEHADLAVGDLDGESMYNNYVDECFKDGTEPEFTLEELCEELDKIMPSPEMIKVCREFARQHASFFERSK